MKQILLLLTCFFMLCVGSLQELNAQGPQDPSADEQTEYDGSESDPGELGTEEEANPEDQASTEEPPPPPQEAEEEPEPGFHQVIKQQFIAGDWRYMSLVLICLILGLAVALERIITLNLASVDTDELLRKVEAAVRGGDIERAKKVCRNHSGPVASIFSQGFLRISEGIDAVEKSIVAYGSVEMGKLEKGVVWISLFISLAPMLGFLGTVIGMVNAFDAIAAAGDVSPSLVADGIKIALITTVGGLIVAIILQLFYNYVVSKIDSIVNKMEDASISLVDILVKYKKRG
ncbi:MAG: MotA/TolQ/ExbB proton channel family protein [Cytophagales bacterium]|nr:MotA/TolQ/ExbB proton channel family protein [Cytophagales bacterium]